MTRNSRFRIDNKNAVNSSDSNIESAYNLLRAVISDIKIKTPNLFAEATALQLVLNTKISKSASEAREREKRISESTDKLGALISEAEKAEDQDVKYLLYVRSCLKTIFLPTKYTKFTKKRTK